MDRVGWMSSCAFLFALLAGCGGGAKKHPLPTTWSTGYWLWAHASGTFSAPPLDALFIHVGDVRRYQGRRTTSAWTVQGDLPGGELPAAKEHWLVFRFDQQGVPDLSTAAMVADRVSSLRAEGPSRHLNIVGVQLDIDSPTSRLSEYAAYLAAVRKELREDTALSITALLDWFRDGTQIDAVIERVDEFVPQFYDSAPAREELIAAQVDASQWGPRFNRFGKRYRIGISTFGRAKFVTNHPQQGSPTILYREVTPFDFGPEFGLDALRNATGEMVLTYRAKQTTRVGYSEFREGDGAQFIVPTPHGVRSATAEAKKMGEYAAGVVYFRWPSDAESFFVSPEELLAGSGPQSAAVETVDGGCVAVKCVDITLRHADRFAARVVRYRVRSSGPLDYFLPAEEVPARLISPNEVELTVPPFAGRDRFTLGRAVSTNVLTFTVEAVQ